MIHSSVFPLLCFSLLCSKASGVGGLTALFGNAGIFIYCVTVLLPDVLVPVLKITVVIKGLIFISEQNTQPAMCSVFCCTFNM